MDAISDLIICKWEKCHEHFSDGTQLRRHLSKHIKKDWERHHACLWTACNSKKYLRMDDLQRHARSKHSSIYICSHPGCPRKEPFRDLTDLRRHGKTKHSGDLRFECPFPQCSITVAPRVDKLLSHVKETIHENDSLCIFSHCRRDQIFHNAHFRDRREIMNHYRGYHISNDAENGIAGFNCNLGSCAVHSNDHRFSREGLAMHVREDHKAPLWRPDLADVSTADLVRAGLTTALMDEKLGWLSETRRARFKDCQTCYQSLDITLSEPNVFGGNESTVVM